MYNPENELTQLLGYNPEITNPGLYANIESPIYKPTRRARQGKEYSTPEEDKEIRDNLYVMQLLGSPVTANARQEQNMKQSGSSSFTRRQGLGSPRKKPLSVNSNIYNI